MFSFETANRGAPKNTKSPSKTSGRRGSANVSSPFSTVRFSLRRHTRLRALEKPSLRDRKRVAQEYCAFRCGQFAGLNALQNLPVAVALLADLDGPSGEPAAVGRDPNRHR